MRKRPRKGQNKAFSPDRIAKEQMTSVVWTTPLGLPIVQPYRKTKRNQVVTALQTVYLADPNSPAEGTDTCRYEVLTGLDGLPLQ
jgi:DNA-directed RNA polymerase